MIKKYAIHNFKIHQDTTLDLASLTILTGANSAGKSSVFQTMLMLRESILSYHNSERLLLKGNSFDVGGKANTLISWGIKDEPQTLRFEIGDDKGNEYRFEYSYPADATSNPDVLKSKNTGDVLLDDELSRSLSLFCNQFQYLSAFRVGPKWDYNDDTEASERNQVSGRMGQGEYAVMLLSKLQMNDIGIAAMKHPEVNSLMLIDQVQAWMNEITSGVKVQIEEKGNKYQLNFGYAASGSRNRYASAMNSGYGVGYVFSLIVALLTAKPGGLVIIENPEAHIHPAAQAALMRLVTIAAANGIQVLLETHSDHIINAALVDLKRGMIKRDELSVYFFLRDEETLAAKPEKLFIGQDCRIKRAPKGFFDQMKSDLDVLFGL